MIVVLLVVIWGIALVPMTMRRLAERHLTNSVTRFMSARRILRRNYPPLVAVGADRDSPLRVEQVRSRFEDEHARRIRRRASQLRIERRRRTLALLVGGTTASAVFGSLPHLHPLWDVSFAGLALTATYVVLLVCIARRTWASSGQRPFVPVAHREERAEDLLLVVNARYRPERPSITPHPAFVLVEAPS